MRRMIRNVAVIIEAVTKIISNFFLQRVSKYSITPRGLRLSITTSSNTKHTGYERVSDLPADPETSGSKYRLGFRLTRDSFSLMPVAMENRSKPNKSRSNGSTSVKMSAPSLLSTPGGSWDVVSVLMSGMVVGFFAGSASAPGPLVWQIADPGYPAHRERMKR